jgi:hypothetical protein
MTFLLYNLCYIHQINDLETHLNEPNRVVEGSAPAAEVAGIVNGGSV